MAERYKTALLDYPELLSPEQQLLQGYENTRRDPSASAGSALRSIVDSEDEYIKLINPRGQRIGESARPNLMMGDMRDASKK